MTIFGGARRGYVWTNPYITDGLVAMWDGEWNAGGGVHDASATTWKDLSGNGYDLDVYGDHEWQTKGLRFLGTTVNSRAHTTSQSLLNYFKGSNSASVQIVGYYPSRINSVNIFSIKKSTLSQGNIGVLTIGMIDNQFVRWIKGWTENNYLSGMANFPYHNSITYQRGETNAEVYLNDVLKGMSTARSLVTDYSGYEMMFGGYYYWQTQGKCNYTFRNVRIYNRALTADEIAANYEIDKVRFGL